jgi:hypothetical protein
MNDWVEQARELARDCGADAVVAELDAIDRALPPSRLRVVFLGEDMRGKSTLVNRLAGREVVPMVPTTEVAVLEAGDRDGVEIDSPSLRALDAQIIDTPGLGAGAPASSFLQADIALLVVSATSPVSMSEQALLGQRLACGRVPYPAVVVTKLDLVETDSRAELLRRVTGRVRHVAPTVPVVPAWPGPDGLQALERFVVTCRDAPGLDLRRARQAAWRVHDAVESLIALDSAGDRGQPVPDGRAPAPDAASSAPDWGELASEMRTRRAAATERSRVSLVGQAAGIAARLSSEARTVEDPKRWWEQFLPDRLAAELQQVAGEHETELTRILDADFRWLQEEVERRFQVSLPARPDLEATPADTLEPSRLDLRGLETQAWLFKVGAQAAAIAISLVLNVWGRPADMAAELVGTVGAGWVQREKGRQRATVIAAIRPNVDRTLERFAGRLAEQLAEIYRQAVEQLRLTQRAWLNDVGRTANPQETEGAGELLFSAQRLRDEIAAWLAESMPPKEDDHVG